MFLPAQGPLPGSAYPPSANVPSTGNPGRYPVLARSVAHEIDRLHEQLWEQEKHAVALKWKAADKVRHELAREQAHRDKLIAQLHEESPYMSMPSTWPVHGQTHQPSPSKPSSPRRSNRKKNYICPMPSFPGGRSQPKALDDHAGKPNTSGHSAAAVAAAAASPHSSIPRHQDAGGHAHSPQQTPATPVHDYEPPPDDAEVRHEAIKDRCTWLYLKGRLEGFEVLIPEFVFDGVENLTKADPDAPSVALGRRRHKRDLPQDAELWGKLHGTNAEMRKRAETAKQQGKSKEELDELYREGIRRMDAAHQPSSSSSPVQSSKKCSACGVTNHPDAKFCKGCGRQMQLPPQQMQPSPASGRTVGGEDALKHLRLLDSAGNLMRYVSHRPLEPTRRRIFSFAFPECTEECPAYQIIAEGGGGMRREFTALCRPGVQPKLVEGQCSIDYKHLTPSDCVEYMFHEQPDKWRMANLGREAMEAERSAKASALQRLLKDLPAEPLQRIQQNGPVTNLYDSKLFPTPYEFSSKYQAVDESRRTIHLPHPVSRLRIWDTVQQRYEFLDAQLAGVPPDKTSWWRQVTSKVHHPGHRQNPPPRGQPAPASGSGGHRAETTLTAPARPGDTVLHVASENGFMVGDDIIIGSLEKRRIAGLAPMRIDSPLNGSHGNDSYVRKVMSESQHGDWV